MGCSKVFFHYSNTCPGVLTLYKWHISDMQTLEQPKCRALPSLTTTSVATQSECVHLAMPILVGISKFQAVLHGAHTLQHQSSKILGQSLYNVFPAFLLNALFLSGKRAKIAQLFDIFLIWFSSSSPPFPVLLCFLLINSIFSYAESPPPSPDWHVSVGNFFFGRNLILLYPTVQKLCRNPFFSKWSFNIKGTRVYHTSF